MTASTTPPSSPTPAQTQAHFLAILSNWHISDPQCDAILPATLRLDRWTAPLLAAVHELSLHTVGQKERAHRLLTTYFQERVRQGRHGVKGAKPYAELEEGDVEKAIRSAERMSKGLALVDEKKGAGELKRRYSIRDELETGVDDGLSAGKTPTSTSVGDAHGERNKRERHLAPALPDTSQHLLAPAQTPLQHAPLPRCRTPAPAKHRRLPPIKTQNIHRLVVHAEAPPQHLVQEAQHATHEFNVRRLELEKAERHHEAAKQRYADAARRMECAELEANYFL